MKHMFQMLLLPLAAGLAAPISRADEKKEEPLPTRTITRFDPRLDKLLAKDAKVETIARGFIWSEGPLWSKEGKFFLFSDIPRNVINKWEEGKGLSVYMKPSGYTGKVPRGGKEGDEPGSNGLTFDPEGRLTMCEHGDRRVTRVEKDGKKTVLADKYMGKRFNSPNDLVYNSKGDLYFTDPPYGLLKWEEDPAREMDYCGVFLRKKSGELLLLIKDMSRPNGIAFSPDEKTLYVANSDPKRCIWKSFPVKPDGTLGEGKLFFDATKWYQEGRRWFPDGMKLDVDGNIWATGPGGIYIFTPAAEILGRIDMGDNTGNVAWGEDGSVLYICANHDVCRLRTTTKGMGY